MTLVTSQTVNPNRYRLIFALLGVGLAAVVIGAIVFAPRGSELALPAQVDAISPENGEIVLRQTQLEIDLAVGYRLELFVDGVRIPEDEIEFTEPTGRYVWRPNTSTASGEWAPGIHAVVAQWDREVGLPDPGELRWSFRVQ